MSFVLLLLLPFSAGCGEAASGTTAVRFDPCQPLALIIDATATAGEAGGVGTGLTLWNRTAHSRLFVPEVSGAAGPVSPQLPIHFQAAAALSHGFYDRGTGEVFINTDLADHAQAITVAHEIGHAFGLSHVSSDRQSVMKAGNLDTEPGAEDVDTLSSLWGPCLASAVDSAP